MEEEEKTWKYHICVILIHIKVAGAETVDVNVTDTK